MTHTHPDPNGLAKNGLAEIGLTKIGQIRMAKTGLAKVGPFRILEDCTIDSSDVKCQVYIFHNGLKNLS